MTDFRDPNDRDPHNPGFDDPARTPDQPRSNAMWGWIAGFAIAAVIVILTVGSPREPTRTAVNPETVPASPTTPPAMRPDLPAPGVPAPTPAPPESAQ